MDLAIDRKMVILQGGPLSGHVVYAQEEVKEYHEKKDKKKKVDADDYEGMLSGQRI
jgi:tRNA uridine 5-carbamoylmethylation protein Kti12